MDYKMGQSSNSNVKEAVREATSVLKNPKLILFFSRVESFEEYTKEIKNLFPDSIILGATSIVEICKKGAYKDNLLLIGIESGIECYGGVLQDAQKYPLKYVDRIQSCVDKFINKENTICLEFCTALISCEEYVLSTMNSVLEKNNIPLIGGSAGDNGSAGKTMVSLDGNVYEDACVFVIIKNLGGKINLYRENIYKLTKNYFTATKVDIKNRIVYEYDNKPAAQVIAKALNTNVKGLEKYLDSNPMARIIGNEMYITANQRIIDDSAIAYHARVYKNARMVLLEPDDYRKVIRSTMEKIKSDIPNPSLSIMVHCLARTILFENDGYMQEFSEQMGTVLGDYVGFSGYGEQLNRQHFNQTMVIAVFE